MRLTNRKVILMKNKGFTLIELLSVIVIIAIIAVITTPIVVNIIQSSKENAFKDTAHGLVVAAGTYQAQKQALKEDPTLYINYKTSSQAEKDVLTTKGVLPDAGEFKVDENGKVTLALWSDDAHVCVVKSTDDKEIVINKNITKANDCKIANINK